MYVHWYIFGTYMHIDTSVIPQSMESFSSLFKGVPSVLKYKLLWLCVFCLVFSVCVDVSRTRIT